MVVLIFWGRSVVDLEAFSPEKMRFKKAGSDKNCGILHLPPSPAAPGRNPRLGGGGGVWVGWVVGGGGFISYFLLPPTPLFLFLFPPPPSFRRCRRRGLRQPADHFACKCKILQ